MTGLDVGVKLKKGVQDSWVSGVRERVGGWWCRQQRKRKQIGVEMNLVLNMLCLK